MSDSLDSTAVADLTSFLDAAPTPFHAVKSVRERLEAAGYRSLDEREEWTLAPGDKRYVVRAGGSIVAFELGTELPEQGGFLMIGAHTDSPTFRLKANADVRQAGYHGLGVEVYGGVLLHTWLDRDLSLAGRVSLRSGVQHLVQFEKPLCRINSLAIHLNRTVNTEGLKLNPETQLRPVLCLDTDPALSLVSLLTQELARMGVSVSSADIVSHDLSLFDVQGASIGGVRGEFLHSARLDNLVSCHAAISALLRARTSVARTRVVALYDHEEVGSQSNAGAKSRFLIGILERLARGAHGATVAALPRALARSLLVSADMAHAVHPSYPEKHSAEHAPQIGGGPVIKLNANQSYATDGPAAATFEHACTEAGVHVQRFISRNDSPCGSTIGPVSAALMGVRTVDVGTAMLSMHSCRESMGTKDVEPMIAALTCLLTTTPLPAPDA